MSNSNCNPNNINSFVELDNVHSETIPEFKPGQILPREIFEVPGHDIVCSYSDKYDSLNNVTIPGVYTNTEYSCGGLTGFLRCSDCGTFSTFVKHCDKITCPTCYSRVVRRSVNAGVQRLHGFKRAFEVSYNPRHIIFSKKEWLDYSPTQIRKSFKNLLSREMSSLSGVYVLHYYRIKKDIQERLREFHNGDSGCYHAFWDDVRKNVLGLGSWLDYVFVSPHIHFVGWGYLPKSDEMNKKNGLFYLTKKQIGFEWKKSPRGFGFTSDVINTLTYLGSHCAVELDKKRQQIITPVGYCIPRYLKETSVVESVFKRELICPKCQSTNIKEYDAIETDEGVIVDEVRNARAFVWKWLLFVPGKQFGEISLEIDREERALAYPDGKAEDKIEYAFPFPQGDESPTCLGSQEPILMGSGACPR